MKLSDFRAVQELHTQLGNVYRKLAYAMSTNLYVSLSGTYYDELADVAREPVVSFLRAEKESILAKLRGYGVTIDTDKV